MKTSVSKSTAYRRVVIHPSIPVVLIKLETALLCIDLIFPWGSLTENLEKFNPQKNARIIGEVEILFLSNHFISFTPLEVVVLLYQILCRIMVYDILLGFSKEVIHSNSHSN